MSAFAQFGWLATAGAQPMTKMFGDWKVDCKLDRMSDAKKCQISLPLDPEQGSTGPRIGAELMTLDLAQKFVVMTGVHPIAAQIRVDKNKQHAMICKNWCDVSDSQRLAKELPGSARVLVSITTVRGNTDSTVSSRSFELALQEAKRWTSAK